MSEADNKPKPEPQEPMGRRTILMAGGLTAAGILTAGIIHELSGKKPSRKSAAGNTRVFVAKNQRYEDNIANTIRDGLIATGLQPAGLAGKKVLLKPNMVEPTKAARHMTTHPAVLLAVAQVFRDWHAEVIVGEAPGHVRDTEMALVESGIREALDDGHLPFADLNYEETQFQRNLGNASKLKGFDLPQTVVGVDLIVSLPKMKTHHWMGVTASMKNMYGVIPGIRYGWPKNVLHFYGIEQTVFDINSSIPKTIAVVDGIDCMEGDGPIMGTKKHMGLLIMGTVLPAVDATVCRLMGIIPEKIPYLALANHNLGPLEERYIQQVGEPWEPLSQPFEILNVKHLQGLKARQRIT
jgi:uncharacterized protein (DUF362 family)